MENECMLLLIFIKKFVGVSSYFYNSRKYSCCCNWINPIRFLLYNPRLILNQFLRIPAVSVSYLCNSMNLTFPKWAIYLSFELTSPSFIVQIVNTGCSHLSIPIVTTVLRSMRVRDRNWGSLLSKVLVWSKISFEDVMITMMMVVLILQIKLKCIRL